MKTLGTSLPAGGVVLCLSSLMSLAVCFDAEVIPRPTSAPTAAPADSLSRSNQPAAPSTGAESKGKPECPPDKPKHPRVVSQTVLTSQGTRFAINGRPTFLYGMSYYGALGATEETIRKDLKLLRKQGFNWIRVWATWAAFDNVVSAVDPEGNPREEMLQKLKWLVAECDRRRMVVDITLSRGNGITGPPRLQSLDAHQRAVETITTALRPFRNWYWDLSNERNIRDQRFTSFSDLKLLRQHIRKLDPKRLVTASHAGDIQEADLREYLLTVRVDFIAPHRPRNAASPGKTEERTRAYLLAMKEIGRLLPVHYQEPFRRGFGKWQPAAGDYVNDAAAAKAGAAAGWCFHNGDERHGADGRPRRSFDLRGQSLFEQLDPVELEALKSLEKAMRE